jgi:hypothetical protein
MWELESGVYHVSQPIFYSQNLEGDQELVFCKDGYIVIAVDDFKYRRSFRLFAEDGKVYYGYSERRSINTDNGIQTIVDSNLEILDLSNYATKEYVDEAINALKIEILGELDEIGDLVGGEESGTEEVVTIIETAEYEFVDEGEGANAEILMASLPPISTEVPYNFTFGDTTTQITFTFDEDEGMFVSGNPFLMGIGDDTGEIYFIGAMSDSWKGPRIIIYTSKPAGTYIVGLSYKAVAE